MGLPYKKLTQEQDDMRGLIMEGEYQALITSLIWDKTKLKKDKDGNPLPQLNMAVIDLLINDMGRDRSIKSWVMMEGEMAWMFRHLAIACGLLDKYENDTLEIRDFLNKKPIIKIVIKTTKSETGDSIRRNNVSDYLPPCQDSTAPSFDDNDINF